MRPVPVRRTDFPRPPDPGAQTRARPAFHGPGARSGSSPRPVRPPLGVAARAEVRTHNATGGVPGAIARIDLAGRTSPTRLVLMEILGATLRVCVDDLEAAVPFYERLAGGRALRFERGGVSVAAVGCFLLMSG